MNLQDYVHNNLLRVKVKPNAKRTEVIGIKDGRIIITLKSPAVENKANEELVKYVRKQLKKTIRIKSGVTSKDKTLLVN